MVIDQGTLLDRIDYNVEMMKTNVKEAQKELVVASGYQKKTTKRKAMLLLVICIVGVIILLTLKPKRSSAAPPPVPDVQHPVLPPSKDPNTPGLINPGGGNRINHPGGGGETGDPDATVVKGLPKMGALPPARPVGWRTERRRAIRRRIEVE